MGPLRLFKVGAALGGAWIGLWSGTLLGQGRRRKRTGSDQYAEGLQS